ncbi:MAG: NAD(P)-dependent oxidoreductase [Thaumarchaeota archaeon]|nr:MAG: NAD(P)-dependent oxidoreductase [Nitrososphaerota archaeon]TLX82450.1 MAG: NAD(P)-dependent oxidoreductase [Nitrososphaerota archaeon]
MNIGIIGTGFLGKAVAIRLLNTGHKVIVYNRTKNKTESLKNIGVIVADTPKDLAQACDLVITIVKDSEAVESVSFDKNGIIHGKHDGLTVADMSTINPISSQKIAKRFLENGISMIDTPVMGGPSLAEKGELVVMIGGKKEVYEKYKHVFDHIGNNTFYLGENGSGHAMKLAMNLQISLLALALSEGITFAKRAGLDPKLFLEILNSTYFKTGMSVLKGPKMINGNFDPSFTLKMMKKDLDTINNTAKEFGTSLPMATLANEIYQNAVTDGLGELDYTGILAFIEKISKL